LRSKLPKTPIFLAKIFLHSSYILGKTWLTACKRLVKVIKTYLSSCPPDTQKIKNEKNITIKGKYWSSYVQWRNQLLLTP